MNRKATIKLARDGFKAEVSIELRSKRPCAPYLTIDHSGPIDPSNATPMGRTE